MKLAGSIGGICDGEIFNKSVRICFGNLKLNKQMFEMKPAGCVWSAEYLKNNCL